MEMIRRSLRFGQAERIGFLSDDSCGTRASSRDGFPATASERQKDFFCSQDLRLFFFFARLFFWRAGSPADHSILGSFGGDWPLAYTNNLSI
jgi:hypothetical protein